MANPSYILFNGTVVQVINSTGTVANSGLWHTTNGSLDVIGYVGTANQLLTTNGGPTDTAWVTVGGDLTYSGSGNFVVNSLSGGGGQITVNGTQLMFNDPQVNPTIGQFTSTSLVAANSLKILAQTTTAAASTGGNLTLTSGAGTSTNGLVKIQVASNTVQQMGQTSSDFIALGATPGAVGNIRATYNSTIIGANGDSILSTDASKNVTLNTNSLGLLGFSIGGTTVAQFSTNTLQLSVNTAQFVASPNGGSAPTISQVGESSTIKASDFTIQPQQSSHATDAGGGNLVLNFQTPSGSGARAGLKLTEGGAFLALLQNGLGTHDGQCALWMGKSLTPSQLNFTLLSDGSAFTVLNAVSGAVLNLSVNSSAIAQASAANFSVFQPLLMTNQVYANSATAGANGAVPNQVNKYLSISLDGVTYKIPLFNV